MVDSDNHIYKVMVLPRRPSKEDIRMRRPSMCPFGILLMIIGIGTYISPYMLYMLLGTF
jgi:hypothetical protein